MPTVHSSWLKQGFFILGNEGLMPAVREELERLLSLSPGGLRIKNFPVATNWKHTYWWREDDIDYAEAQFFAQIAKEYPILSLGVAVEKGYENPALAVRQEQLMTGKDWDWTRLVRDIDLVLTEGVVAAADALRGPITVRVRTKSPTEAGENAGWQARAFSLIDGDWYERYVGKVQPPKIADHIREVDGCNDAWAIVHFATDITGAEADGLTAGQLAKTLFDFNPIRQRLRV